ncbi:uncharacterized protein LOC144706107 [Wolffia australiana]
MIGESFHREKTMPYVPQVGVRSGDKERRQMTSPELSLSPLPTIPTEAEQTSSKKRKFSWNEPSSCQTPIELQLKDPLPFDWEQCLDLQSGRMYYLNRKTMKRSWSWPKNQVLDLELNISPPQNLEKTGANIRRDFKNGRHPTDSMMAVACPSCHLLVMLSRISPSCPNCKFVHNLPQPSQKSTRLGDERSHSAIETLSLLY